MPLVPQSLAAQILAALNKQAAKSGDNDTAEQSAQELAEDLASVIDAYIKTGLVTVNGTIVGVAGSIPVTGTCTATGNIQ